MIIHEFIIIQRQLNWTWTRHMIAWDGHLWSRPCTTSNSMLDEPIGLWLVFVIHPLSYLSTILLRAPSSSLLGFAKVIPCLHLFIYCANILSRALWRASSGSNLDSYVPAPSAQPIFHLIFANDCLLLGQASLQNAVVTSKILEEHCCTSG